MLIVFTREREIGTPVVLRDLVRGGLPKTATATGSRAIAWGFDDQDEICAAERSTTGLDPVKPLSCLLLRGRGRSS